MDNYFEEYIKHSALNFRQGVQGIRYLYSHPDIDEIYKRGSLKQF